jgi:hypothetical protein
MYLGIYEIDGDPNKLLAAAPLRALGSVRPGPETHRSALAVGGAERAPDVDQRCQLRVGQVSEEVFLKRVGEGLFHGRERLPAAGGEAHQ